MVPPNNNNNNNLPVPTFLTTIRRPNPPSRMTTAQSRVSKLSFRSFRSHSSSFEADDERSSSAESYGASMGPESDEDVIGRRLGEAQYPGEDTRLTSRRELWGWYAYGFAAEVFVICGVGKKLLIWPKVVTNAE